MISEIDQLSATCQERGLTLNSLQLEKLFRYSELILEWNDKINLISRKDEDGILIRHVLHSLSIGFFHPFKKNEKVLDIGTGGGLPGIPLAIAFPETHFLLIDSIGKKIAACDSMIKELGIKNAYAKKSRSEELKNVQFDIVVSRQVAPMLDLVKWSQKLLKENGKLLCLKGGKLDEEIEEALVYGAEHLTFPDNIELESIEFLGEKFEEKFVVIAS